MHSAKSHSNLGLQILKSGARYVTVFFLLEASMLHDLVTRTQVTAVSSSSAQLLASFGIQRTGQSLGHR